MCIYYIAAGKEQITEAPHVKPTESRVIGPTERPAPAYYNSGMHFYTEEMNLRQYLFP